MMEKLMYDGLVSKGIQYILTVVIFSLYCFFSIPSHAALISISQFPLQLAAPANPQVLIAIGNSQSMMGI